MTKERVNISIDSEILIKAKKHIPNLSGFVEECLKHYFGYADGIFPIGNVNEITDKIGKLQVELFLINQNLNEDIKNILTLDNFINFCNQFNINPLLNSTVLKKTKSRV